jgi:hypothetical protein
LIPFLEYPAELAGQITILQYEIGGVAAGLGGLYAIVLKNSSKVAAIHQFLKDVFGDKFRE